jgi:hypothetical protein
MNDADDNIRRLYIAPIPYHRFDAILENLLDLEQNRIGRGARANAQDPLTRVTGITVTRRDRSSGSCDYTIEITLKQTTAKLPWGVIRLMHSADGGTTVNLRPGFDTAESQRLRELAVQQIEVLEDFVAKAWELHTMTQSLEHHASSVEDIPNPGREITEHAIKLLNEYPEKFAPGHVKPPQRGDSIDRWLDWRDAERRRRRRRTLEYIAEQSGFSLSMLKKASAARKFKRKEE